MNKSCDYHSNLQSTGLGETTEITLNNMQFNVINVMHGS